jgi:hypothetical protein
LIPENVPNFLTVNFEPHLAKPVVASLPFALLGCPHGAARMSNWLRPPTVVRDCISTRNRENAGNTEFKNLDNNWTADVVFWLFFFSFLKLK